MSDVASRAIIALGSNVPGRAGPPPAALARAIGWLGEEAGRVVAVSSLWKSAPFGLLSQPPFFNAVVVIDTPLSPRLLMKTLRRLENRAGRRRGTPWGPRALDLDLLAHGNEVTRPVGHGAAVRGRVAKGRAAHAMQRKGLVLPHPGIAFRSFVLLPLAEAAPRWRHPASGRTARHMLSKVPPGQRAQCRKVKSWQNGAWS